ncbi:hypothetical protein PTKIN_Ptkin06aG0180700 [Pterospermum kingtungense]
MLLSQCGGCYGGLAPPRVENFSWFVLRGKLAVRKELVKRGLIDIENASCVFCRKEVESVEHLFISCDFSWNFLMFWVNKWNLAWCAPIETSALFMAWQGALSVGTCSKIWRMVLLVSWWSLWLHRNNIVFNGINVNMDLLIHNACLRLAFWCKAKWSEVAQGMYEVASYPNLIIVPGKTKKSRGGVCWNPPSEGILKFNMDGAARGCPGPTGIRGILWDSSHKVISMFSKLVGIIDSNLAELLAVKEAIGIFSASQWVSSHCMVIESDLANVVKWVRYSNTVP